MTTTSPALPVPNPAETVRRPTRVLAAFMSEPLAQNYAGQTLNAEEFMNTWKSYQGRVASLPASSSVARVQALSTRAQQHADAIQSIPIFRQNYGPEAQFAMVELGRLIAFQFHVDMDHSAGVHGINLATTPNEDEILNTCLPLTIVSPAATQWNVTQKRPDNQQASVTIATTDLTFDIAAGFPQVNASAGQLVALFGSGANLMMVRQHGDHLVLANGYHRAYALRSRGVNFVPVVLVPVPAPDDLVAGGPFLTLPMVQAARPPVIDDFLEDNLSTKVDARALMRVVRVNFESLTLPRII